MNQDKQPEALPCPFCGKEPTLTKHHKEDAWGLTHRCEVLGPISFSCGSRELHIKRWNRRTPAQQAQHARIAELEAELAAVKAAPAESQRLAQFLLNMQTRLGSCREACGDESSMRAWDDYSLAAAALVAPQAQDVQDASQKGQP